MTTAGPISHHGVVAELGDRAVLVLRQAYRSMRAADPGDRFALYAACRIAIETLAPVDTFYIALIRAHDQMTVFPYTFNNGLAVAAEILPYGEHGLTAWMLVSRTTYHFSDDNGALINRGYAIGEASELSGDAIVVPIAGDSHAVIGLMAALSTQTETFTAEHALAMEYLADALSDTRRSSRSDRLGQLFPELIDSRQRGDDVFNLIGDGLTSIHEILTRSLAAATATSHGARSSAHLSGLLTEASEQCLRLQARIAELTAAHDDPLTDLSAREREVADLIIGMPGISNSELAQELHLSEATVKTHVSRILVKTGCTQRSELRHLAIR